MDESTTELPEAARVLDMLLHDRARDASSAPGPGDPDAIALAAATGHDFSRFRRLPAIVSAAHVARAACIDDVVRDGTSSHGTRVVTRGDRMSRAGDRILRYAFG